MPPRASRTMSRDHHSPMVSSERATGHRLALNDLCRIAPHIQVSNRQKIWLHHYTRFVHPRSGCIMQPERKPNCNSKEGYIPMKNTDKTVEVFARTTRNGLKRISLCFGVAILAVLASFIAPPNPAL